MSEKRPTHLKRRLRRALAANGERVTPELTRVLAAFWRREAEIDAFRRRFDAAGGHHAHCCLWCWGGHELGELYRAQERTAEALVRLLEKRRTPGDLELAGRVREDYRLPSSSSGSTGSVGRSS